MESCSIPSSHADREELPGRVVVVGDDFLEFKVNKVVGVKWALFLLRFDWRLGLVEIPISGASSNTGREEDER